CSKRPSRYRNVFMRAPPPFLIPRIAAAAVLDSATRSPAAAAVPPYCRDRRPGGGRRRAGCSPPPPAPLPTCLTAVPTPLERRVSRERPISPGAGTLAVAAVRHREASRVMAGISPKGYGLPLALVGFLLVFLLSGCGDSGYPEDLVYPQRG